MPRLCLAALALFLIISSHCLGSAQLFDWDTMSDPTLDLFSDDDLINAQVEIPPDPENNVSYYDFLADISASDCSSTTTENPSKVRARGDTCTTHQEPEVVPSPEVMPSPEVVPNPDEARDAIINNLLGPLDGKDLTGETTTKNFVLAHCPNLDSTARGIPVCSSGKEEDEYPNALGGWTLRNCVLCGLACFIHAEFHGVMIAE